MKTFVMCAMTVAGLTGCSTPPDEHYRGVVSMAQRSETSGNWNGEWFNYALRLENGTTVGFSNRTAMPVGSVACALRRWHHPPEGLWAEYQFEPCREVK